jgi:hypothetical protein
VLEIMERGRRWENRAREKLNAELLGREINLLTSWEVVIAQQFSDMLHALTVNWVIH